MRKKITYILVTLFFAVLCVVLYIMGFGSKVQYQLSDILFQQGEGTSGKIFILEIDEKSLDELGPFQTWTRDYVAEAIEKLNENQKYRPAAIGVDILYIGQTTREADEHLVSACSEYGNVVMGSLVNFETAMLQDSNGRYYLGNHISLYEEPFESLKNVTEQGFVNGFSDEDGIIRHGVSKIILQNNKIIPSFAYAVYQKYAEANNIDKNIDIPANKDGYWYIPFQAKPGGYSNSYSLSDFIQGEIPLERFGNSVVLIGPYAEGLMDSYRTAIDHTSPMYGVEIHANMIDAMLKQDFKIEVSEFIQVFLIFLTVLIAGFWCYRDRLRYCIIFALFSCVVYPALAIMLYKAGFILNVSYIPVIAFIAAIYSICVHYIKELLQKRQVVRTFKRYVDSEIVDEIIRTGMDEIQLGGKTVDIACLFVDIRGFTTMSEQLEPEEVVAILNQYLNLTSSCIFRHHGTLDKFIGDATMALFNVPLPQQDYVYQAVLTAWDMVKEADKLGEELLSKFGKTVSFGIGVHCGKAVVGNIGTDKRMDYTAIGDTVNTAARLEANAPRGTILISSDVYEKLKGKIKVESCGNIPLKGKSNELEVFKVTEIL